MPSPAAPSRPTHARVLVLLAMRNQRRHLRRSVLTASAMIVGGALLVFTFSLGEGSHEQWIDSGVRLGEGHVTIERPEFRVSRRIEDRLPAEVRRAAEEAFASPEVAPRVVATTAKLAVTGLASSAAGSRPAQIVAVDPMAEAEFSPIDDKLIEGRYLAPDDRLAAYVGVELVDSLDLRLGSRFVVQAQDAEREIAGQLLRVVGIFRTGVPEVDQALVHIPLATADEWLGSKGDVTNVGVVLDDSAATAGVVARVESALDGPISRGDARVMGWREANPALAAAVAIDDFGGYLTQGFIFTIIGFGIVNTVLMSVLHRRREFGVLRALGLTPGQTGTIVLIEGLTLTAASGFIGVGLGLAFTRYFFGDGLDVSALMGEMTFSGVVVEPVIQPLMRTARLVQVLLFILFIGAAASVYPALRAARLDVAEAMKFDR